jgi:hypothetical protein
VPCFKGGWQDHCDSFGQLNASYWKGGAGIHGSSQSSFARPIPRKFTEDGAKDVVACVFFERAISANAQDSSSDFR